MSEETMRWVLALLIPSGLAWATAVIWLLRDIKKQTDRLLQMHLNADEEGFGTKQLTLSFMRIETTMRELLHYVKWGVEKQTGEKPPPREPEFD